MAGAGRSRGVAGATIAVLLGLLPAPASAADSAEVSLAAGVLSVAVDDLDGDGIREVIALTAADGEAVAVEAWTEAGGAWHSLGRVTVPVSGILGRTRASGYQDGLGLLVVDAAEGPETLLFVGPEAVEAVPGALAIHAVELRDARLALRPVAGDLGPTDQVYPLDVDGDGVDEILVVAALGFETRQPSLTMMRRSTEGWTPMPLRLTGLPDEFYLTGTIADTDGLPGAEIFVQGGPDYATWRVAIDADGSTHVDRLAIEDAAAAGGPWTAEGLWLNGAIGGQAIVAGGAPEWVTVSWPRGSTARIDRQLLAEDGFGQPPFPIGSGEHERVVLVSGSEFGQGPVRILSRDFEHAEATLESDPMAADVAELLSSGSRSIDWSMVYPVLGPVPYGLDGGEPALWLPGAVTWVDAAGDLRLEPARTLLGATVFGSVGTDNEWLALANGWPSVANLYLRPIGTSPEQRLTVVPRAALIGEEAREGNGGIGIERLDGREIVGDDGVDRVASDEDGFGVRVSGPPGTLVVLDTTVQPQVIRLTGEPRDVTVNPPSSGRRDRRYRATMIVVTPSGFARVERWDGLVVREGPELSATATTVDGELAAIVRGTVEQTGGEVLVDGRPVEVAADGTFEVRVDAAPWPHAVDVVARDILGVEARARVDTIGFVDYRGWPWAVVVGVLTIGAGLVLFLRIPRGDRSIPAVATDGDGTLEEIAGD